MQASPNSGNFDDLMVWVAGGRWSGTYQSLVSGGFNGNMLAPFQGVMVHRGNGGTASTPQPASSFQFNKTYQTTAGTLPQFTRQTSQGVLNIEVAGNGYEDVTYVEFRDNATTKPSEDSAPNLTNVLYPCRPKTMPTNRLDTKMISSVSTPTEYSCWTTSRNALRAAGPRRTGFFQEANNISYKNSEA